jgi:O-antigen/teichoic acid export membrane protein
MWQVVFPTVSRLWEQAGRTQAEDFLSRLLHVYLFVGCGIALLVSANANEVITLFASEKFAESAHILRTVALVLLVYGTTWIFGAGFHLQRRTGLLASLMAGAAILNVVLNVLLIPDYGLRGAVLATVGSYGMLTAVLIVLSRRYIAIAIPVRALITCVVAAGVAAAVLQILSFDNDLLSIAVKCTLGAVLYLVPVLTFDPVLRDMARAGIHRALPGPASVPP